MKTQSGDEFIPTGVHPTSWLAFEGRIQQRRFRSLLENAESCIERGDVAGARVALDEARTLRSEGSEVVRLETRLAGHAPNGWSRDFHVRRRGRVIAAASVLGGATLLLAGQSWLRSDTARGLPDNPAPTIVAASAPTPIGDNGRGSVVTTGSVRDLPVAAAPPLDVPAPPVAPSPPAASPTREAQTVPSVSRRPKPVELAATPARQPFGVTESSAPESTPSVTAPVVTLRVTPATPTPGVPVSLTVTLTIPAGRPAPRVTVDWGDGTRQDIGIVPTVRTVTHTYADAGDYAITASASWDGETSASARPASVLAESPGAVAMTTAQEMQAAAVPGR